MTGLAAGALMAAMLPGVATAKSDNAATVVTMKDEGVCSINATDYTGTGWAHIVDNKRASRIICHFTADSWNPAPPPDGLRSKGPTIYTQINKSGHGHFILDFPAAP